MTRTRRTSWSRRRDRPAAPRRRWPRHLADLLLRELEVASGGRTCAARARAAWLPHGAAREAQARRADGGAEAVERAHRDLEALPRLAQQRVVIDAAIGQAHGAQRVQGAMTGCARWRPARRARVDHEGRDAARAGLPLRARRPRSGRPGRRWRSRSWCRRGASRRRAGAWRWCSSPPRRSRHRAPESAKAVMMRPRPRRAAGAAAAPGLPNSVTGALPRPLHGERAKSPARGARQRTRGRAPASARRAARAPRRRPRARTRAAARRGPASAVSRSTQAYTASELSSAPRSSAGNSSATSARTAAPARGGRRRRRARPGRTGALIVNCLRRRVSASRRRRGTRARSPVGLHADGLQPALALDVSAQARIHSCQSMVLVIAWPKVGPLGQALRQRLRFGEQLLGSTRRLSGSPLRWPPLPPTARPV